jgi:hypothetical protein
MIDIHQVLAGLAQAIGGANFLDVTALATTLDLDISQAKITKTETSTVAIYGARLNREVDIGLICGVAPRRSIWLVFSSPSLSYGDLGGEVFGNNQRIEVSKFNDGLAVLFETGDWICSLTASLPGKTVLCLSCEEPRPASANKPPVTHAGFTSPPVDAQVQRPHVSCETLLQSDWEISHSAPFEHHHFFRGLCVTGALRRNKEYLAGAKISHLLPY